MNALFWGSWSAALLFLSFDVALNIDRTENSRFTKLMDRLVGTSLRQLRILNFSLIQGVSNYAILSIWLITNLFLASLLLVLLGNLILTLVVLVLGIVFPRILLEHLVDAKREQFEREFLRFVQLLKSRQHTERSIVHLLHKCVNSVLSSNTQLASQGLFSRVKLAASRNKRYSDSFALEASRLGMCGLHIKSLSLFLALLRPIEKTGKIGNTFRQLEQRMQADLAIRDELRAKTAGAKWEMGFMALVPPLALLIFAWFMPSMVAPIFVTAFGQVVLAIAVGMITYAVHFASRTLRISF